MTEPSCPHAPPIFLPRLVLKVTFIPAFSIFETNLFTSSVVGSSKGRDETGFHGIRFTFTSRSFAKLIRFFALSSVVFLLCKSAASSVTRFPLVSA